MAPVDPHQLRGIVRRIHQQLDGRQDWLDEVVLALPDGEDGPRWKRALSEALADQYLDGVNVRIVPGERPDLVACRFCEQRF